MARSKSSSRTPTMMLISSEPCAIMRMEIPSWPSAANRLPDTPGRPIMLRPTVEMSARLSTTLMLSGVASVLMSATIDQSESFTSEPCTTTANESMPEGMCSIDTR